MGGRVLARRKFNMRYLIRHTKEIYFDTIEEARAYRDDNPNDQLVLIVTKGAEPNDSEFEKKDKDENPYGSHFDINPFSAKTK